MVSPSCRMLPAGPMLASDRGHRGAFAACRATALDYVVRGFGVNDLFFASPRSAVLRAPRGAEGEDALVVPRPRA